MAYAETVPEWLFALIHVIAFLEYAVLLGFAVNERIVMNKQAEVRRNSNKNKIIRWFFLGIIVGASVRVFAYLLLAIFNIAGGVPDVFFAALLILSSFSGLGFIFAFFLVLLSWVHVLLVFRNMEVGMREPEPLKSKAFLAAMFFYTVLDLVLVIRWLTVPSDASSNLEPAIAVFAVMGYIIPMFGIVIFGWMIWFGVKSMEMRASVHGQAARRVLFYGSINAFFILANMCVYIAAISGTLELKYYVAVQIVPPELVVGVVQSISYILLRRSKEKRLIASESYDSVKDEELDSDKAVSFQEPSKQSSSTELEEKKLKTLLLPESRPN